MNEIYDCHKYLKIPIDTLWNMRVRDRRFIIARHNKDAQDEKQSHSDGSSTTDIEKITALKITTNHSQNLKQNKKNKKETHTNNIGHRTIVY